MSKILPIFIPFLGCSNRCIFCNQEAITSVTSSIDYKEDIETQFNNYSEYSNNFNEIAFYGGNFGALPADIRKYFYNFAKEKGFNSIRYSTRVDTVTDELLDEAIYHNVNMIELGIQSLDDEVLRMNERPYTSQDALNAINKISSVVDCGVQMMIGMYGEKRDSIIIDSLKLKEMRIKTARLYPTLVLKDTKLEKLYKTKQYKILEIDELLSLSAIAMVIFLGNNIDVIRLSLPSDVDANDNIIAGRYHESYGDIVRTLIILLYLDIGFNIKGKKDNIFYLSGYKGVVRRLYPNQFIVDDNERTTFEMIVKTIYNWGANFEDSFRNLKIKADKLAKIINC